MILNLEVRPSGANASNGGQTVGRDGGFVGRDPSCLLVLADLDVSRRHARIRCQDDVFYIEDLSVNGTFLTSRQHRLQKGRQYPLKDGDQIFIGPYTIDVAIGAGAPAAAAARPRIREPRKRPEPPERQPSSSWGVDDPFTAADDNLFEQRPSAEPDPSLDPIKLMGLEPDPTPVSSPHVEDLDVNPFQQSFHVPEPEKPATPYIDESAVGGEPDREIPAGYNPMFDDSHVIRPAPRPRPAPALPQPPAQRPVSKPEAVPADLPASVLASASPSPRPDEDVLLADPALAEPLPHGSTPRPVMDAMRSSAVTAAAASPVAASLSDLASVLQGAGLDPSLATPELGRQLGEILRVVVSEMRTLLQSRVDAKEELGARRTRFMPAENNPLKFSVNVEDALHNLLVKRNPAYLGPAAAFSEAFADVKHHQLALLAGVRQAFDFMLAEFEPARLEERFDSQAVKALVPGKLRYWDQYRQRMQSLAADPDATFRDLFGDAFARAYVNELARASASSSHAVSPVEAAGDETSGPMQRSVRLDDDRQPDVD